MVLSLVVALVLLEIAPDNRPRVGDLVEAVSRVDLEDGTVVERKFRAEVLAMKVIDQVAVVQINGPDRPVWVAETAYASSEVIAASSRDAQKPVLSLNLGGQPASSRSNE